MLRVLTIAACSCAAIAVAACGGSDKPGYCTQREQLTTQIAQIRDTNVIKEGTDTLSARVDAALTQTQKLADSAKSDFPNETRDLDVAVKSVKTSLDALQSADTRATALTNLPGQLQTTVDSAKRLQAAVQDKCS
jgi:hypothetical protein